MGKKEFEGFSKRISAAIQHQEDIEKILTKSITSEITLVENIKIDLESLSKGLLIQVEGVMRNKSEQINLITTVQRQEVAFLKSADEVSRKVIGTFNHITGIVGLAENRLKAAGKGANTEELEEAKLALESLTLWLPMFRASYDNMKRLHESLKKAFDDVKLMEGALEQLKSAAKKVVDYVTAMQGNVTVVQRKCSETKGFADNESKYASEGIKHDREVIEVAIRQMDEETLRLERELRGYEQRIERLNNS